MMSCEKRKCSYSFLILLTQIHEISAPKIDKFTYFYHSLPLKVELFLKSPFLTSHITYFSFYLGFLSRAFTIHRAAEKGLGYLFNSSLLFPPASRAFRHQPDDYCGKLTSAHRWQPDSDWESSISECKLLTTKLRALKGNYKTDCFWGFLKKQRDVSKTITTTKIGLFAALVSGFQPLIYSHRTLTQVL